MTVGSCRLKSALGILDRNLNGCLRVPGRIHATGQQPTFGVFLSRSFKGLFHSETCRTANGSASANPDLDPTEDTGGLVPVTSLLVGDQDKRLLSEAANASTRPADLIEIVKRAPIGR